MDNTATSDKPRKRRSGLVGVSPAVGMSTKAVAIAAANEAMNDLKQAGYKVLGIAHPSHPDVYVIFISGTPAADIMLARLGGQKVEEFVKL